MAIKYFNPDSTNRQKPAQYQITAKHPWDVRDIVETFTDLLTTATFSKNVYENMRVLVADEGVVYELVASGEGMLVNKQFLANAEGLSYNPENKKFWKRLTIETIAESVATDEDMRKAQAALQRAKNNLVNGALIYIANDITLDDGTTQKSGLYFCQNVDGGGVLTMAGGGELEAGAVTTEKIKNGAVTADKLDQTFLNRLATKAQYNALTAGMVAGEGEEPPTIMGAIEASESKITAAYTKAIETAIYGVLDKKY